MYRSLENHIRGIMSKRYITEDETKDKEEVTVGGYQTRHFDMCADASKLYKNIESKVDDVDLAKRAAKLHDNFFRIKKEAQEEGEIEDEAVMSAKNLKDQIMKMAGMMGLEKEHKGYMDFHMNEIEKMDRDEEEDDEDEDDDEMKEQKDKPPFTGGTKTTGPRKDRFGNVIKKQNVAKHLAKKAMRKTMGENVLDQPVMKPNPEDNEPASPDEKGMALQQLRFIKYATDEIAAHVDGGGRWPEWMQNKLVKANYIMKGLHSYIDHEYSEGMSEEVEENFNWKVSHGGKDVHVKAPHAGAAVKKAQKGFGNMDLSKAKVSNLGKVGAPTNEEVDQGKLLSALKKKLSDEGGAAAFKPLKDVAAKMNVELTPAMLKGMSGIKLHRDGDYILESAELKEMFASTVEPHKDGFRPKVVKDASKVAYLGQHVYKSKEHARNAADHIANAHRKGRASDSYIDSFARRHHKEHGLKESVELKEMKANAAYTKAAKDIKAYAAKDGGIDKKDMMNFAADLELMGRAPNILQAGQILDRINKRFKGYDTDVRDRLSMYLKKNGLMESVELEEKKLTPAEMKKREEIAKAIERENPNMPMDQKMAISTAQAKKVAEVKSAPKGYHFTRSGQLKKGDADQDGDGGKMLRSDPLDKQRKKIPPLPESRFNRILENAIKKKS